MNLFDIIPSNFFNLLSSQSNGDIYAGCLMEIYLQYEHEISYRIPRERIRDAVAAYLLDHHLRIEDDDLNVNSSASDMATTIIRRFCAPEVGWLTDEIDDTTFGHNIVMTEQGIKLAEFLESLEKPERAEFSGYIFDIYNRLTNEAQWQENPYVNALNAVFRNARDLSHALKQLSTFIRDIIERMVQEQTLESLTNNILEYCNGEFVREYARLNKQQNIHVYRNAIITKLNRMENSRKLMPVMIRCCMDETGLSAAAAEDLVAERFRLTRKFLRDDYDKIMNDIRHKITVYLQIAVGRARFLQNRDPNTRGYVEQTLRYLINDVDDAGMKDLLPDDYMDLFTINSMKFLDTGSLSYPGRARIIRKSVEQQLEIMTDEERQAAIAEQKAAAYNPYSKTAMKRYVLDEMHGATTITSDEMPLYRKEELLAALSAVAYGQENGFDVEPLDGYYESNDMKLRRFRLRKRLDEENHDGR